VEFDEAEAAAGDRLAAATGSVAVAPPKPPRQLKLHPDLVLSGIPVGAMQQAQREARQVSVTSSGGIRVTSQAPHARAVVVRSEDSAVP
jgi:hypothetical protein